MSRTDGTQQVTRRRVMYIPGFDPMPPRTYRERYRREAAKQAKISGYQIDLSKKQSDAQFGWRTDAQIEGVRTVAEIEVLYWADIVRRSMTQSILGTYVQLLRTAWIYIGSGALFRLMRLRKGPVIAALYPVFVLLIQLAVAAALGWLVGTMISDAIRSLAGQVGLLLPGWFHGLTFALVAAAVAGLLLRWCQRKDHLLAWYLMHDYAFSAQLNGAYPPEQEARMATFADQIAEALGSDVDEVLVVGHSSGAYIAISILADLIRSGRVPDHGPALSLLTLGHVVPMVSFLRKASILRADLKLVSTYPQITWVDVTAPGDGCSFALCDPVSVSGVAPDRKRWPLVISAAYSQTLSSAEQKRLKWKLFELHFQYLNAFDQPGDYDYFQITAGPLTLADRFAGRAPSKSRIETPVNRFTDIAA